MSNLNLSEAFEKIDEEVARIQNGYSYEHTANITSLSLASQLPRQLAKSLSNWEFGEYGWTSPTNLLVTAAWTKWLNPMQNVCKIWATDSNNTPIEGGYSIRSYDEQVTVKIFCKYMLTTNFCSNNSGMQGSRAIEKAREYKEIKPGLTIQQRVLFSMDLFVDIMTRINSLDSNQAHTCFLYFFYKSLEIKGKLMLEQKSAVATLQSVSADAYKWILNSIGNIKDPEFTRALCGCLCAARWPELFLMGLNDAKTSANARSQSPGDFWLNDSSQKPVIAGKCKAEGIQFSWKDLSNAKLRLKEYPSCKLYLCITADNIAMDTDITSNPEQLSAWIKSVDDLKISHDISFMAITLRDLARIVLTDSARQEHFFNSLSTAIVTMPSLDRHTIELITGNMKHDQSERLI